MTYGMWMWVANILDCFMWAYMRRHHCVFCDGLMMPWHKRIGAPWNSPWQEDIIHETCRPRATAAMYGEHYD